MGRVPQNHRLSCVLLALLALAGALRAQPSTQPAEAKPSTPIDQKQQQVLQRVQQLEERLLKLNRQLAQAEPEKAQRLRDALDQCGKAQVRQRMARLVELLKSGDFSQAEQQQEALLADLDQIFEVLSGTRQAGEDSRAARKQLEEYKQIVRQLMDDQNQNLYDTGHAQQRQDAGAERSAGLSPPLMQTLHELEQKQRELQKKADQLTQRMDKPLSRGPENAKPAPGGAEMKRAAEAMRQAADQLGQRRAQQSADSQRQSLASMQSAMDELEDALRQARQQEREETLAALEARLTAIIANEKKVRDVVAVLMNSDRAQVSAGASLLADAQAAHRQATTETEKALAVLVDEGTTVIIPELLRQVLTDMGTVDARLNKSDVSQPCRAMLDAIIAQLEELLASVEQAREKDAEAKEQGEDGDSSGDETEPLVPNSSELKLLRSRQVMLNQRSESSGAALDSAAGRADFAELGRQQRLLAQLTETMNERK